MVKQAADYPWSSARLHLGVSRSDALVRDKSLMGLVGDWAEYLMTGDEPGTQSTSLCAIRTGRPVGSEQFVKSIEKLTSRNLAMRRVGRPVRERHEN
jgi:putative transposase